jgi:hypothetical protein
MNETPPVPLTPYERMALEAVEQGCLVTPALLERLRKNGWAVSGKAGLRLMEETPPFPRHSERTALPCCGEFLLRSFGHSSLA